MQNRYTFKASTIKFALSSFWKGITIKENQIAAKGSKFFPFNLE